MENTLESTVGYLNCLNDTLDFLKNKTEWTPKKRMVDAVEIIENFIAPQMRRCEEFRNAEIKRWCEKPADK